MEKCKIFVINGSDKSGKDEQEISDFLEKRKAVITHTSQSRMENRAVLTIFYKEKA